MKADISVCAHAPHLLVYLTVCNRVGYSCGNSTTLVLLARGIWFPGILPCLVVLVIQLVTFSGRIETTGPVFDVFSAAGQSFKHKYTRGS